MDCTYTFNTSAGEVTIKGMAEMKAWLLENGVDAITGGGVMASNRAAPTFFSQLERAIEGVPDRLANQPAAQWKAWIASNAPKLGIKKDEIEWSGINDYLDLRGKDKVTREDLAAYLAENGVRVEEVRLTSPDGAVNQLKRALSGTGYTVEKDFDEEAIFLGPDEQTLDFDELPSNIQAIVNKNSEGAGASKYGKYTLPGGENYREVLLTLPESFNAKPNKDGYTPLSAITDSQYRSTHWDQPNVVAHIRVNDRTDADGNKVLFVEEVQSDWGQEGKKKGFKGSKTFTVRPDSSGVQALAGRWEVIDQDGNIEEGFRTEAEARSWADIERRGQGVPAAPFVSKTEGWLNLALKRIVMMAVEGGYDKVAFVNGKQSADRYDLSKQVESISYGKTDDGKYNLGVMFNDGRGRGLGPLTESELEDNVGKEVAQKIINGEGKPYAAGTVSEGMKQLSNIDLKIGGEGMKTFYDQIVPNAVSSLIKKMGGKVETVSINSDEGVGSYFIDDPDEGRIEFETRNDAYQYLADQSEDGEVDESRIQSASGLIDKQLGFTVTDKMRETVGAGVPMFSKRVANLADDLAAQDKYLQQKAEEAGYKDADEFVDKDYAGFVEAAAQWRRDNPVEMMMAKRGKQSSSVKRATNAIASAFVGRDELGNVTFGAGSKAYDLVAGLANTVLDKMYLKPIDKNLSRAMRQMKVEINKARELTVDVAEKLGKLTQQEREVISDVIEGELRSGKKPPKRILQVASSMQSIMSEQTAELVRLGMLSEDAAGRWDGKYLPRFYESKLKTEAKGWAKAAKALLGRQKTMQGIGGSNLKGRGKFQTIPVAELEKWLAEGWEERDPNFDPATDTEITIWRDYTRTERDDMGEIRDAMFRFVMGYNKSQRDISLGRLYENIANTVASKKEKEGYVQVPRTNVEDTYAKRYGKLAGMWVPQEVLDHLSAFDDAQQSELMKMYLKGMSLWKEGKTVLNPVSHANNVMSNITMAHFAGVSYWDIGKYIGATRDLINNSAMVKEAKDAGLWTGTMTQAELVQLLPDQLKVLAAKTESTPSKVGGAVWDAMSFWLRKPLGKAYEAEDLYFRYLIYRDARKNGLKPADAVDYAQKYIFTYDDLPKGARKIRDFALPFFAYTYKVVPTLAETALKYPWRYAAPAAALYTVNAMMYAFAASLGGGEDEDWWTVIQRYVTDPEFRAKAQAMEADERKNLPPWMKGASLTLGTSKAVRLGVDELTGLPVFLDVSRIFPGGDLFDAHNNAGGLPLLAPITPNSPILTTAYAMLANKDTFRGTEVVKPSDTSAEAAAKRAGWVWSQFTPAIAVGNGHFDRAMNVIANQVGQPINLGFAEYTGTDKQGMPVQGKYAAMQTVGVKARPIDLETSEAIQKAEVQKMIREIDAEIKKIKRLENKGAISFENAERQREYQKEKRQRLKEGLTVEGNERE